MRELRINAVYDDVFKRIAQYNNSRGTNIAVPQLLHADGTADSNAGRHNILSFRVGNFDFPTRPNARPVRVEQAAVRPMPPHPTRF